MSSASDTLLVITNLPDRASAETLAAALVERRVAACANVMSPCRSVYRWRGTVEHAEEHPVFAKTTGDRFAALQEVIREVHPYELPEIIAVGVDAGLPAYLEWVAAETRPAA
ncbi:MAG: divalent-cation tolerance protein CutA [Burkholderiales bacterium]|nr:divalent-cation tolerance protein CutA [Burkholderiales bacterium]